MLYKWKKAATTPCGLCVSFGTFTYTAVVGRATERKAGGANPPGGLTTPSASRSGGLIR